MSNGSILFDFYGGLAKGENSIPYWENMLEIIRIVNEFFEKIFDISAMRYHYPIIIDNIDGRCSGYAPVAVPFFGLVLCIKLRQNRTYDKCSIVFEYAHELTHAMFFYELGINKFDADTDEEAICTAMSLICVKKLMDKDSNRLPQFESIVKNNSKYRAGYALVRECEYNVTRLKSKFDEYCRQYCDKNSVDIAS